MRLRTLILSATMAVASLAMAQQDHTCQGGHNCNGGSPGENTSQAVGIGVGVASSDANSSSSSNSSGGSVRSNIDVSGGQSTSRAAATVGDVRGGTGGDARGGKSSVEVDNSDSSTYSYKEEQAVASAASVFAGYCQTGMSGSVEAGGFSVVNPEAFCNNIRMAAVMQEAYLWELKHGSVQCSAQAGTQWIDDQVEDHCVNDQAAIYYARYTDHLDDAHNLLERTNAVATVDSFFGYLVRPLGVIAVVILML